MKKGGEEIVIAPSMAKMDDMVGNAATKYEFPDNQEDSDKVSQRVEDLSYSLHFMINFSIHEIKISVWWRTQSHKNLSISSGIYFALCISMLCRQKLETRKDLFKNANHNFIRFFFSSY